MYLLLNTSEKSLITLTLFDETFLEQKTYPVENRELLSCVDSFLQEKKLNKKDVQGIVTIVGTGAFTSTRIATTVANAWAYVEKIPVAAISLEEASEPQKLISKLLEQPVGMYVSAMYSAEPNIGKARVV